VCHHRWMEGVGCRKNQFKSRCPRGYK
jgi:hypothetical protein